MTEPVEGAPVFRDRRRIDPETYEVREPVADAAPGPGVAAGGEPPRDVPTAAEPTDAPTEAGPDSALLDAELAELTSDLQRLSAEYANYRRRVERDRDVVRETAVACGPRRAAAGARRRRAAPASTASSTGRSRRWGRPSRPP